MIKRTLFVLILGLMSVGALAAGLVDFESQIQTIFDEKCVTCHGTTGSGGLTLTQGSSFDNLVGVTSQNTSPDVRVVKGDLTNSVLFNKLNGTGDFSGSSGHGGNVSQANIDLIATWIAQLPSADSDNDGVMDGGDNCPETESGSLVDKYGCQTPSSLTLGTGWSLISIKTAKPMKTADIFSGNETSIVSAWKWIQSPGGWAVTLPKSGTEETQTYATAKGFNALADINPGEGFWVNSDKALSLLGISLTSSAIEHNDPISSGHW